MLTPRVCCSHLPLPAAAASTFSGCPLAELTPILSSLMEESVVAGNEVIEGLAPKVLAAANAIPEAEYESIETPLLNYANNVSVALVEPELLAEVEATYPGKHGWLALHCMMCFADCMMCFAAHGVTPHLQACSDRPLARVQGM